MESKIILLNEPGKIITPKPAPEANSIIARRELKPIEKTAREVFDKMSPEEQEKVKENFEKQFGANKSTRTKLQWNNLVSIYGLKQVAKIEKLTPKKVALKCGFKKSKSSQMQSKKK